MHPEILRVRHNDMWLTSILVVLYHEAMYKDALELLWADEEDGDVLKSDVVA